MTKLRYRRDSDGQLHRVEMFRGVVFWLHGLRRGRREPAQLSDRPKGRMSRGRRMPRMRLHRQASR